VSTKVKIAVIAMQGDYAKHLEVLRRLGAEAYPARLPAEVAAADGIILPGGESTTIGKMLARYGVDDAIKRAAEAGKAVYGTCAGLILLARALAAGTGERGGQPTLGLLDVVVARNAFGRQVDSFEAALAVPELGAEPLRAVFIRAPYVVDAGPSVETLARHDGKAVFVRQGRVLGSAFHPELADDDRVHRYFLALVREGQEA
jgi:5'-phosphate synthase pdxT subunit